jgi:hypothetical protein
MAWLVFLAALAERTADRKRRRTLQGKSTAKDPRRRRIAVCESSDTESCDSQCGQSVEQRTATGRRRRHLSPRPQGRDSGEDRCDPAHSESDSSTNDGEHVGDAEANEAEVAVRRQRRKPWKASEEDFLKKHAERKSWEEIGKKLDRSPSGYLSIGDS